MLYRIVKEVEAKSIVDAIKKDKKGEIVYIESIDEEHEEEPQKVGFQPEE